MALGLLGLFGVHKLFLLYLIHRYRDSRLPHPRMPEQWPPVTVQLPVFNERFVLKRLIRSVVSLDYPRSQLDIQILDDSTDCTAKLARRLTRILRKKGFSIRYFHRMNRNGFKAGALENGLAHSSMDYLAVFDADFVPDRGFLKDVVPYLLMDGIGMVQTRWGHINRDDSFLTRLQAIFLDGHFMIEHPARFLSDRFFNFNGTAGMWRRKAIEDAGGWQHDTLTEDLDLSYRAQLAGWRFVYLPDVVAPAELPTDIHSYKSQQHRWAKGSVQTAIKLIPRIMTSPFPFKVRLEAVIHLLANIGWLLMAVPAFLLIPTLKYQFDHNLRWPIILYLSVFLTASVSVIIYYSVSIRKALGKLWPHILYIPLLMAMGIGLSLNNGRAVIEGLLGKRSDFIRTPKLNVWRSERYRMRKRYLSPRNPLTVLEFALGLYFAAGMVYFLKHGVFLSVPYFILFQIGFFYLSVGSFRELRRSR